MEAQRVPKIFISYRREDSLWFTNLLHQTLAAHFGIERIFRDVHDIDAGEDFKEVIKAEVDSSDILLAVIGKDWKILADQKLAGADEDFVQFEIATALRKKEIIVAPILVEGASVPRRQDLPKELERLVGLQARTLTDRSWAGDTKDLIRELEAVFQKNTASKNQLTPPAVAAVSTKANSFYGLYGGSFGGLLAGVIFGVAYVQQQQIEGWRTILIGFYGLVAGALLSIGITGGIARSSSLLGGSPFAKVAGAILGGVIGGLAAAIAGGFGFAWLEGGTVAPVGVTLAVAFCGLFIAAGILWPELRKGRNERLVVLITLVVVTVIPMFFVRWLLNEHLEELKNLLATNSPISVGGLILGLISGAFAGIQVGATLFVYDRRFRS